MQRVVARAAGGDATVAAVVAEVAAQLQSLLGNDGEREARELVAAVMHQPRFWPSTAAAVSLDDVSLARIREAAARRAAGAPLAYAVRSAPFRHLSLYVDERVLIPRPETEYLIDLVLATPQGQAGGVAVDIGTGSGAIALALASEGSFARVIATDISGDALAVARENAARLVPRLRCPVDVRAGDALSPLEELADAVDVLVSNPPYIAFAETAQLPSSVRDWEPPQALVCADDGLAVTRAVIEGGGRLLRSGGLLAFETDSRRARRVAALAQDDGAFDNVRVLLDLTGRERFVLATRRPKR